MNQEDSDFITYNLNPVDDKNFYLTLKDFTDCVLDKSKFIIEDIIFDYCSFLDGSNNKYNNSYNNSYNNNYNYINNDIYIGSFYEECVLEALYLGVLWKLYIDKAIKLDPFFQNILAKLSNLRNDKDIINSPYKDQIDEIRGPLATKFLLNSSKNFFNNEFEDFDMKITLLLKYLEAAGDYKESLKHLNLWKDFLLSKDEKIAKSYLNSILLFTSWFKDLADEKLHFFTSNVDDFVNNHLNEHMDKEDILFCGRVELEYHINLLGAEIMNRVFHSEFEKRERIAILLPKCMKILDDSNCSAIEDNLSLKCMACSSSNNECSNNDSCNIGKFTKLVKTNNKFSPDKSLNDKFNDISVYITSHSSSILSNLSGDDKKELGIIGVACINNLIEGGWKISSYGIPPQCVILNHVGCKNHWAPVDIQTNFDIDKLHEIIM